MTIYEDEILKVNPIQHKKKKIGSVAINAKITGFKLKSREKNSQQKAGELTAQLQN